MPALRERQLRDAETKGGSQPADISRINRRIKGRASLKTLETAWRRQSPPRRQGEQDFFFALTKSNHISRQFADHVLVALVPPKASGASLLGLSGVR
jgi:hypothetical protein